MSPEAKKAINELIVYSASDRRDPESRALTLNALAEHRKADAFEDMAEALRAFLSIVLTKWVQ